jgi:hypothetical protein
LDQNPQLSSDKNSTGVSSESDFKLSDFKNLKILSKLKSPIFMSSNISLEDFNLLFIIFASRFNISFKCSDALLKFFNFVLPQPNKLMMNFNSIVKQIEISSQSEVEYLCSNCWSKKKNSNNSCHNNECKLFGLSHESTIELYLFDINEQLNEIINREESTISRYILVVIF